MDGRPCLVTSNQVFVMLTRGRGPFVRERYESGAVVPAWKTQTARHGVLVEPVPEGSKHVVYNVALAGPFRSTLELTRYFRIDAPGTYTVYWGMRDV